MVQPVFHGRFLFCPCAVPYTHINSGGLDSPVKRAAVTKWVIWANAALDPALFTVNPVNAALDPALFTAHVEVCCCAENLCHLNDKMLFYLIFCRRKYAVLKRFMR